MTKEQTLAEWQKDRGMSNIALADKLNIDSGYVSQIRTGRVTPGEKLKESFRKTFPGYDVIEMRPGENYEPEKPKPVPTTSSIYKGINTFAQQPKKESKPMAEEVTELPPKQNGPVKVYVLTDTQDKISATAHMTKLQAYEELAKYILNDPEAYGFILTEAVMK